MYHVPFTNSSNFVVEIFNFYCFCILTDDDREDDDFDERDGKFVKKILLRMVLVFFIYRFI